jgi:hypothetical protein
LEGKFYWNSTPMFGVLLININNRCTGYNEWQGMYLH